MTTMKTKRILLSVICIILAMTFCGCTENFNIVEETINVVNFATDLADLTTELSTSDLPDEQKMELINETIFHSDSEITIETIMADQQIADKLPDLSEGFSFDIASIPNPEDIVSSLTYNEEIGGNTYTTTMDVIINGVTITIEVTLLSRNNEFGIYDYEIK